MRATIRDGKIKLDGETPRDGEYFVEFIKNNRTNQQNKALHKFCQLLADELTEKHIDKREFFRESYYAQWTPISVKEDIWKPVQKALTKKESTRELSKSGEIDLIWDTINKLLIEKYAGEVQTPPFPSKEITEYSNR